MKIVRKVGPNRRDKLQDILEFILNVMFLAIHNAVSDLVKFGMEILVKSFFQVHECNSG